MAGYSLAARTAHLLAREAVGSFDEGDWERLLAALDALVELVGRTVPSTRLMGGPAPDVRSRMRVQSPKRMT